MAYSGFSMATDGTVTRMVNDATKPVTLKDYLNKYNSEEIPPNDFLNTMRSVKYINKYWGRLPKETKSDVLKLLKESNTPLGMDLTPKGSSPLSFIDTFANSAPSSKEEIDNADNNIITIILFVILILCGIYLAVKSYKKK